jgi:hypothetical protein
MVFPPTGEDDEDDPASAPDRNLRLNAKVNAQTNAKSTAPRAAGANSRTESR